MFKNVTIAKISDHGGAEKTPTHAIVVSDEKFQNKQSVGKLWTKTSTYGKYLSGKMNDEYTSQKDGKRYSGYVIISEDEYNELKRKAHTTSPSPEHPKGIQAYDHPFTTDTDREEMDLSDIPN